MPKFIKKNRAVSGEVKSVWSHKTRRLFQSLNEIPWLSLTALGTLLGVTILFWYFRSIDFFPSDFSVLIGLGVGAAASAVGVLSLLTLGLFAPAGFYRFYLAEPEERAAGTKRHFTELEMVGLQLGGVGLTFGLIAYPVFRDCGTWPSFYSALAAVMLLIWAIVLAKILLTKGNRTTWVEASSTAVGIAVVSMGICLVLLPLTQVFRSKYLYADVILFTLWGFAILVNASAAVKLRSLEISILGGLVVVILFVVLPVAVNQRNFFPQMTASFLGIREDAPAELRVPVKTCELISSAVPEGMTSKDLGCGAGDWGKVRAQILSKAGDQWLIELAAQKPSEPTAVVKFRVTIPRSDVQVIREVEDRPFLGKPSACKVTRSTSLDNSAT
ncbi:MAG: hypothetical protein WA136_00330 [Rhodoferax sp.]